MLVLTFEEIVIGAGTHFPWRGDHTQRSAGDGCCCGMISFWGDEKCFYVWVGGERVASWLGKDETALERLVVVQHSISEGNGCARMMSS